jgi:hypothetical protein
MKGTAIELPRRATYDDLLRVRAMHGGPGAVKAALTMMERHDPISFEQALELVLEGGEPSPRCRKVVAEAWDLYFHISSMPWD